MADFNSIAQEFVKFYYAAFDSDRTSLAPLYRDTSMLTFEKEPYKGTQSIIEKIQALPFQKVQHRADTIDAQPVNTEGGILVMVTGALMVDESPHPMNYVQAFTLMSDNGSYFIFNDVFRIVYPASS